MRVNIFLKKYNISIDRFRDSLAKWSTRTYSVHSKLTQGELDYLDKFFRIDREKKEKAEFESLLKGIELKNNFQFTYSEQKKFKDVYQAYQRFNNDLIALKDKEKPYNGLSKTEIKAIMRLKYRCLENIQNNIIEERKKNISSHRREDSNSDLIHLPDNSNPFGSSLGDGEEAYIANWNID